MRNLLLSLFVVLLGINGVLLWQNRDAINDAKKACCTLPDRISVEINNVKASLLPGVLGLMQ